MSQHAPVTVLEPPEPPRFTFLRDNLPAPRAVHPYRVYVVAVDGTDVYGEEVSSAATYAGALGEVGVLLDLLRRDHYRNYYRLLPRHHWECQPERGRCAPTYIVLIDAATRAAN